MFQCTGWMGKNFIPGNFSWRVAAETWDAKEKGWLEKQQCSKHLRHIAIEKDILSELNRCIFQISLLNYLFQKYSLYWYYAVLIFTSKLRDTPPSNKIKISDPPPPQQRLFWNFWLPAKLEVGGACSGFPLLSLSNYKSKTTFLIYHNICYFELFGKYYAYKTDIKADSVN